MLRKLILVVCAMSLTLTSCGHQVTPDRTTSPAGVPSGFIQLKFSTQGTLDFTNNWYILAFNTTGTGEPYARYATQQYNWLNLDFELIVYNVNGVPAVQMYPFVNQPSSSGGTVKVPGPQIFPAPQDLLFYPNCNGQATQFCITISRALFVSPGSPSPAPSSSPTSCPTPTATPSTSPSPSPSASPSATPSGSPSPAPCLPSGTWSINWWVASPGSSTASQGQVIDAPGIGGPLDTTFTYTVDTGASSDVPWTAVPPPGWPAAPSPSSQITGGEVINTP